MVFRTFYHLVGTQFSTEIKKLKTNNGSVYVNTEMISFLETQALSMTYHHYMHMQVIVYLSI
jgi:hypothetical protein